MNFDLVGKTAIVTGASRGIGAAIARELGKNAVDVALLARDRYALELVSDEIAAGGGKAVPVVVDLADSASLAAAMDAARTELGQNDILVNNAGSSPFGSFDVVDDDDWQAACSLKLMGYLRMIRAVLAEMRARRRGRIVNVVGRRRQGRGEVRAQREAEMGRVEVDGLIDIVDHVRIRPAARTATPRP